jgi:hypothetical protein
MTPVPALLRRTFPLRRSRLLAAACAAAMLIAPPSGARAAAWSNVNPGGGGAFTCAAASPTGIILVGSDIGGVYRSSDHGGTWENIGYLNGGLEKCYVASVAMDNLSGWIVHLGTDGGLYRSTNGGKNFSVKVADGFWSAIAVAPSDGNVVYAACESMYNTLDPKVYRSSDQGETWLFMGSLPPGTRVTKLDVKPSNSSQLFAVSGYEKLLGSNSARRALFVSNDAGVTWTDAHGDSTNQGMTGNPWDAIYDPVHPDTIFATSVVGAGNVDESSSWSGFTWRGSQAGGVWTQVSAHTGAVTARYGTGQIVTIDARRDGPACAECGVFKTVDFGATWTRVSDMTGWDAGWIGSIAWAYNSGFSGMAKTLRRDPSNWGVMYWITPQFVWRSSDWGATFTNLFTQQVSPGYWQGRGMNNVAPASLAVSGSTVYAGYYDLGIWRSSDAGQSWQMSNDPAFTGGWSGKGGNCLTILTDPQRPEMVWASQGATMTAAWLLRNTSGALPGQWNITVGVPNGFISGLALDPSSPSWNRTVYGSSNGDVYRSVDDGMNWGSIFNCDSCYVNAASGSRLFTGGARGLWRSLDGGASWTELAPATFHFGPNPYTLTQAKWYGPHSILLAGGDTVYVAVFAKNRGLYRSIDAGNTWTRILADDFAREIVRDDSGNLYFGSSSATNSGGVGTSGATGVQVSHDAGATWSSLNSGLPWPFAWPIQPMNTGGGVQLFVGSPGSGIWTTQVSGGVPVGVGDGARTPLRLVGFRPNPAREHVTVAFSLPTTGPATIEIFDIAGRIVLRRDVGWMGAGDHVLRLGPGFRPAPGVYTVRLDQGAHSAVARSVFVR